MRGARRRSRREVPLRFSRFGASVSAIRAGTVTILLLLGIGVVLSAVTQAQQITGSIAGNVGDSTGAAVPGTQLIATNVSTGTVTRTVSDSDGNYLFPSLAAGQYKIEATRSGFASTRISGITLDVYKSITVNVVLQIGTVTETVSVNTSTPLIDPTTASIGTTITQNELNNLPLNLQEVSALALTVPGTVETTGRSMTTDEGSGSGFNDQGYSGSGGTPGSNLLLIDGMVSRALNNSSFALNPPPEMVQEFKIQNNVYDATYGWTSGTAMNLITNSGTNAVHASAFELWRNRDLDAVNYFALSNPAFIRNQFGAAVGGPIIRNRLFYFGAYEGLRLVEGETVSSPVPTADQHAGNFQSLLSGTTANLCASSGTAAPAALNYDTGQLFDPATETTYMCPANPAMPGGSPFTILVGTPIPNNDVGAYMNGHLDAVAEKILTAFPLPNANNGVNYINQTPLGRQDDQFDGRIDWTISAKDVVFARYLLGNSNQQIPTGLPAFGQYQHYRGHNFVAGWTHTYGPNLLNHLLVGYQKDYLIYSCQGCPRSQGTLAGFGIQNLAASSPQTEEDPNFSFVNFATWGDGFPGFFPDVVPDTLEKAEDSLTRILGRHSLTIGGEFNFWQTKGVEDPLDLNGNIAFDGQYSSLAGESTNASSASDLADMELGYPSGGSYTQHPIVTNLTGGAWFSAFVQDNIRVNARLNVDAGLRWEYRRQPADENNQIATLFSLSKNFQPGDALLLTALPNSANDALCGQSYFISAEGECLVMTSAQRAAEHLNSNQVRQVSYGPGKGDFAPRLGISWRPTNSDILVLHVGGGIFYDMPDTNRQGSYANNNPVFTRTPTYTTAFGAPPPLTNGVPTTTETMFANAPAVGLSSIRSQLMPSPFYRTPTVYEWSMGIQSQLTKAWALEGDYVGNRGVHNDDSHFNGNQPEPGPGDLQPRRPWPDFNTIAYDTYDAFSNYDALDVKLSTRSENGLSGTVAYTWAKSLDDNGGDIQNGFTGPQDDNNMKANYARSDFDVGQRLVVSGEYPLPFGSGHTFLNSSSRLVNAVAGGWIVSGILNWQTGFPFTVNASEDYSNTNSFSPRPDRVCSGVGSKQVLNWFNTDCFNTAALAAALAAGTPRFGTSGRNILNGPGEATMDLSLIKNFKVTDRVNTELRVDSFNLLNHPNFGAPDAVIGSSTQDQITSAGDPREIQLGFKLVL